MKITPMLRQYFDAKDKQPDSLLFFRMGDFYELFFDDAKLAAGILDIALTSRNKGDPEEIPMAGVPHHAAEGYIQRLVEAGHKVAVCEQLEPPQKGTIVRRDVVRVVTPGVRLEVDPSEARQGNFLAAITPTTPQADSFGVAMCDVSTGQLRVTEVGSLDSLFHELKRASVRELLLPELIAERVQVASPNDDLHFTVRAKGFFSETVLHKMLRELQVTFPDRGRRSTVLDARAVDGLLGQIEELPVRHAKAVKSAAVGLLHYIAEVQLGVPAHIGEPVAFLPSDYVALDAATEANLEIFSALIGGGRAGSLISVIDKTVTSAGARQLRDALAYPLTEVARIEERLDGVERLVERETRRAKVRERLKSVADIPRLTGRIVGGRSNARDLVALATSLSQIPGLLELSEEDDPAALRLITEQLDPCTELVALLERALVEDPPATTSDGGMFRKGYDPDLDELLDLSRNGKDWLLSYEALQKSESGIDSLKLKYNKVFGYYLEVTKANLHRVPENYIRKQTLASAERYFTPELKEYEDKILTAEDRRKNMESELFSGLVDEVTSEAGRLRRTSARLADLDVLAGLAELAVRNDYVRPTINESTVTNIVDGRHPVVEKTTAGERFVPNSVHLDAGKEQLLIVTGPNMAGKSTIIRQVAIITLLGQMGSFVPAKEASLGAVDQIFSRVGASDNLAQGQSTFMVEMTQTAHILRNATHRSLIILDEIGRGTSTFDGLAIAWAVAEHLTDEIGARTMFATHYHELTEIVRTRDRARNVSVAVKEWNDEIVFLRRLVEGPANQSYGIQVGRLAGLPGAVVKRAKQVLANLEESAYGAGGVPIVSLDPARPTPDSGQLELFMAPTLSPGESLALSSLRDIAPDGLTPLQALELIYSLKRDLESS